MIWPQSAPSYRISERKKIRDCDFFLPKKSEQLAYFQFISARLEQPWWIVPPPQILHMPQISCCLIPSSELLWWGKGREAPHNISIGMFPSNAALIPATWWLFSELQQQAIHSLHLIVAFWWMAWKTRSKFSSKWIFHANSVTCCSLPNSHWPSFRVRKQGLDKVAPLPFWSHCTMKWLSQCIIG